MNPYNSSLNTKGKPGKNVFISYRERDSSGEAGRLVDSLKEYFLDHQIFMDIDKIEPGVDFTDAISNSLECCDVMLAIIGPRWMGESEHSSRIKNDDDWVRLEIATALNRNIRVVPVLVDGAELPTAEELPDDLQPLLKRQAYEISNKRWRYDTNELIKFLENNVGVIPRRKEVIKPEKKFSLHGTVKLVLLIAGGFFILSIVLYAMGFGDDTTTDNPGQVIDNKLDEQNKPVNPDDNDGENFSNDVTNNQRNELVNNVETKNVSGIWNDANGLYYLVISQSGNNINVSSFAMNGMQSGEGNGTVNNNQVNMNINVFNVGVLSLNGTVTNNNIDLKGTTTIEVDGIPYTEALHLVKSSKAAN